MRSIAEILLSKRINTCNTMVLCGVLVAAITSEHQSIAAKTFSTQRPVSTNRPTNLQRRTDDPSPTSLGEIKKRGDFDLLARVYHRGRFHALPHTMFVIDRGAGGRIYYVNSRLYRFHKDFVNASYLSLERGRAFYDNNYVKSDRRFLLGTIAYHETTNKFAFEFWEGDQISDHLLAETIAALKRSFFAAVYFKPNSLVQKRAVDDLYKKDPSVLFLTPTEIASDQQYQPLNLGVGIGQLRIIDRVTQDTVIDRNQIVIFKEVPMHLTPLSGIITTEPASALSHINLLAKSWAIPNATIKNADSLFKALEGKYVHLEVGEGGYSLSPADSREVAERNRQWIKRGDLVTPRADVSYSRLTDLKFQRSVDARRFGAKSANLGEIINARLPGLVVPAGFAIPFRYYQEFIRRNKLDERITEAVEEDRFVHDPRYRKTRLAEIRSWIKEGGHDESFRRAVLEKTHREYAGQGLFVRSSTNAEDHILL